jgi:hypothetical protein
MTIHSSRSTKTVLVRNLATASQRKNRKKSRSICASVSVSALALLWKFTIHISHLQHLPIWLSKAPFFICCFLIGYCFSNLVWSTEKHLACILPLWITQLILRSNVQSLQCDWHQTAFSLIIPSGHNFASFNTGAVVSPKLTTPGIKDLEVPPSTVLRNMGRECWSFHGHTGTFGVVLDSPNVTPSRIVIHHWASNSTTLSQAPREVTVWGLVDGEENMKAYSQFRPALPSTSIILPLSITREGRFLPLASLNFDVTAKSLRQNYPLTTLSYGFDFGVIVFDIHNNWGGERTSLCSISIYGHTVQVDTNV